MTWIQTLSGKPFDLLAPMPSMVDFRALPRVLSRIPRFNGHTIYFYSVAQHCVEGTHAILLDHPDRRDVAAAFLLHDAHEAYIGDFTRPLPMALDQLAQERGLPAFAISAVVRQLKSRIDAVIFEAAGLQWPMGHETRTLVDAYDLRMLRTERDALMAPPVRQWDLAIENVKPILGLNLSRQEFGEAEVYYRELMERLLPRFR